ncbi:hypothetical protein CSA37_11615 [Candidatus Fermentibacteria bacterium]|nr:MAG: hypothetical protein CSA37_11615 [Candidatus Fermentibacteria bacterium]
MRKGCTPSELRETFRISITEGVYAQIYISLAGPGSVFLTKLLTALNATAVQLGILAAIGQLSMILQPLGILFTRKLTHHRAVTVKWAAWGRAMTPLLGIFPLFMNDSNAIIWILATFGVSTAILSISANIWMAWMARMVPLRIRGRFFARRNAILLGFGLAIAFTMGLLVDRLGGDLQTLKYVTASVFLIAGFMGLAGLKILARQPEKPVELITEPVRELLTEPLQKKNFRKLCLFGLWWMLAVGIGAPFWQPFMIKVLHMGVTEMLLYGLTSTLGSIVTLRYWGILIDRFGNVTAMKFAVLIGFIVPFVWLFVKPDTIWMLYVEALAAGSMWGCAGVVAANLVLAVAPEKRVQTWSGIYSAFCGTGMFISMLLSGILMPAAITVAGIHLHSMQVLFLITAFARLTALIPLSQVNEPEAGSLSAVLSRIRFWTKVRFLSPRLTLKKKGSKASRSS